MRYLRCVAVAVVPLLLIVAVAAAEEPFPYPPGEKQMIFGFSGWNPRVYQGGLGFRFFHSNRWATNLVVAGAVRSGRRDRSYGDLRPLVEDYEKVALGLVVGVEKYLAAVYRIVPYVGLGLGYTYAWSDESETGYYEEEEITIRSRRDHDVGLHGRIGAEWAFTEGMNLGVQYGVRFSRTWWSSETTYPSGNKYEADGHEWALGMGAGLLTVSIKF
jgi:opacity protein-like surface antigen